MDMAKRRNMKRGKEAVRSIHRIGILLTATAAACALGTTTDVRSPLGAVLSPAAVTGTPVPLHANPGARVILSTASGLPAASFLPSQAERGALIYQSTCATCHGPGALVGEGFVAAWNDRRVYDLYALIRGTMPLDTPAGLKEGEYLDVIAYLLRANRHVSSGPDSLRADTASLRKTRIAVRVP